MWLPVRLERDYAVRYLRTISPGLQERVGHREARCTSCEMLIFASTHKACQTTQRRRNQRKSFTCAEDNKLSTPAEQDYMLAAHTRGAKSTPCYPHSSNEYTHSPPRICAWGRYGDTPVQLFSPNILFSPTGRTRMIGTRTFRIPDSAVNLLLSTLSLSSITIHSYHGRRSHYMRYLNKQQDLKG